MDSRHQIRPDEVDFTKLIGKGSFGEVYRGSCRGKDVAIKKLYRAPKVLQAFEDEVKVMSSFSHPNICLFMGACLDPTNLFIVSEFLPGGDVETILRDPHRQLSLFRRLLMSRDVALAMNWLHGSHFIHRDLKPSNLLLDEKGTVKVCDFGLSQEHVQQSSLRDTDKARGSPLWMAPEVMRFEEITEKVDVYSFGIVLWEFVTCKPPFSHYTSFSAFSEAVCMRGERPPLEEVPDNLAQLMISCWASAPDARPTFQTVVDVLTDVVLKTAISDIEGFKFWQYFFKSDMEVTWDRFIKAFCIGLDQPDGSSPIEPPSEAERVEEQIEGLKMLLGRPSSAKNGDLVVDVDRFGDMVAFFGPIKQVTSDGRHITLLDRTRYLLRFPWFHGDVSSDKAVRLLAGKTANTFLVRFSSNRGNFTFSVIDSDGVVNHYRIERQGYKFLFEEQLYPDLIAVLQSFGFLDEPYRPLGESPFQMIYQKPATGGYKKMNKF